MPTRPIELPVEEIVARYALGESTHELGRAYRVNHHTIRNRLLAASVEMRPSGWQLGNSGSHQPAGPLSDNGHGYLCTYDREGKKRRVHRGCWEAYHGPIPIGYAIHHVDENQQHNAIENLACMPHGEHVSFHRQG